MSTHVGVILDMSGSMGVAVDDTKGSISNYVKGLKKELKDGIFSFTIFDTVFENWVNSKPLKDIDIDNVLAKYQPRGWTALYDAIGVTVKKMKKNVDEFDRAILVIVTDGYENSSRKYDETKINKILTKLQKNGNWTVVFLGANIDSWAAARRIGIFDGNVAQYSYGKGQFRSSDALLRGTTHFYQSGAKATNSLFADAKLSQDYTEDKSTNKKLLKKA